MNLLPVIYASLLIFGSFFLIVLVTSYITYKVKQYNGGVALATASNKNIRTSMKPVRNNSEKVNIIRRGTPERSEVLADEILPKVKKSEHPEYRNEEPKVEMVNREAAEKRVAHTESRRKPQIARMTRVQDLRSSSTSSYAGSRTEYFQQPVRDYSRVSQGSILRYYEDF